MFLVAKSIKTSQNYRKIYQVQLESCKVSTIIWAWCKYWSPVLD